MADSDTEHPQFKQELIREIFKLNQDANTRVSPASAHLSSEYLRLFATEALHRAAEVAKQEQAEAEEINRRARGGAQVVPPSLIEVRHLEKIAAGLLLDF